MGLATSSVHRAQTISTKSFVRATGLAIIPAVPFCEERVLDVWWRDRALQDAYRHEPQETDSES